MNPIEIDVLWNTDESRAKELAGKETGIADYDMRKATFYRIDAIVPEEWEDGSELCRIFVGGEKFTTPHTYEEVKQMIEK